ARLRRGLVRLDRALTRFRRAQALLRRVGARLGAGARAVSARRTRGGARIRRERLVRRGVVHVHGYRPAPEESLRTALPIIETTQPLNDTAGVPHLTFPRPAAARVHLA